jgi:membrane peptidoglycan carboxypeptidase
MRATPDVPRTEVVRPVEENEHYGGNEVPADREAPSPDEPGPKPGGARTDATRPRARVRWLRVLLAVGLITTGAVGALAMYEARTSYLQARVFSDAARTQYWDVHAGASDRLVPPGEGPYDLRLGYTRLPDFTRRLARSGMALEAQAVWSPEMVEAARAGLFVPYHEKMRAGLSVEDRDGGEMSQSVWPERHYPTFDEVPALVRDALVFIENRELLNPETPTQNPAVEWDRLVFATAQLAVKQVKPDHKAPGASTLATQLEKFRHSPEGRTHGAKDKLRQMASASLRAYQDGEDTTDARRRIVLHYVNTVPLGAVPGYGEVQGIGDALWAWFGTDFETANDLLAADFAAPVGHPDHTRRATVFRQVLALFLAQRRPQNFLVDDRPALGRLVDDHLRLLKTHGHIDGTLYEAALRAPLVFREKAPAAPTPAFSERKAADAVRTHLMTRLGVERLYDLDRLDMTVRTSFDGEAQAAASRLLAELRTPEKARAAGLTKSRLLGRGDPSQVLYSFTLFERGAGANLLRVQTDSYDGPFNLNDGMKLELGSTAKLRTLITYLEAVADLHERLAPLSSVALRRTPVDPSDTLTRWAIDWLGSHPWDMDRSLVTMLEAAMERQYTANPIEQFMTGGGLHTFGNFNHDDDRKTFTVRQATYESVNLVYVRLMRDLVRHLMFQVPGSSARLLTDAQDPRRQEYLARFADAEGRVFQEQFYKKYRRATRDEILETLAQSVKATPRRLAVVFRMLEPEADPAAFEAFLRRTLPAAELDAEGLERLFTKYAPDAFDLNDKGFLTKIHPLELWTADYLRQHPGAAWSQVVAASTNERQAVYQWLFRTSRKNAQDKRIKALLEVEAFLAIHRQWKKTGYPFPSLVPSLATALGSSGDRPTALAELMGVIQNDGVRLPTERIEGVRFAEGTPYETHWHRDPTPYRAERVLRPEVAALARRVLTGVVEEGTAKRTRGAFELSDGTVLAVGGKTGTGDNRRDEYAPGGKLLRSTVASRTATFAFFVGDRWFGVITAYVPGADAARYEFTSALPATVLKLLAPVVEPGLMERALVAKRGDATAPRTWRPVPRAIFDAPRPAGDVLAANPVEAPARPVPPPPAPEHVGAGEAEWLFPLPRRISVDPCSLRGRVAKLVRHRAELARERHARFVSGWIV